MLALGPGSRLGSYEILSALGAGGMGEVYVAIDTVLGRQVAIKVLPEVFAQDAERVARFEREAKTLAALNHPHIAQIYGLEKPSGALVMELVEGEDLSQRIARGAISLDDALCIAQQIAEALEAAHEQNIIHRDLKPANVKVRSDGTVKVLDFGLAKALEPIGSMPGGVSMSPTITTPAMTHAGVILGTAAYMSPEQARGKPVDKRADIWAFGCVLFEMLSGRRPFPKEETVSDTLAGILKGEPAWNALPADTPQQIRTLVERCLRKDVRRRLPDIAQARIELDEARSEPIPAAERAPAPHRLRFLWPAATALSLLAAAGLAAWVILSPVPEQVVARFDVAPPPGATPLPPFGRMMDVGQPLSPDGRMVAYVATAEGKEVIWVRSLDSSTARPLPGTEDATRPTWSPDSQYIAFFAQGRLKKVAIEGGPPSVISNEAGREVAWGSGNVILIGGGGKPLRRVSAEGGETTLATEFGPAETTHDYPEFLPDGRHFLYMARHGGTPEDWDVFVGRLDSNERQLLPGVHAGVRYSPTGHLLYLRDRTLMAQPFDVDRRDLTGNAFAVAEGVQVGPHPPFSTSTNGSLAYLGELSPPDSRLAWFDRSGKQLAVISQSGQYDRVALSANSRWVAFDRGLDTDIFLFDIERALTSKFVSTSAADFAAVWSADARTIAFASSRDPAGNVGPQNTSGGHLYERVVGVVGEDRLLLKTDAGKIPTDWSRDGRYLAYTSRNDVWAVPMRASDEAQPVRVTDTPFVESGGRFSPDGSLIAYQSNESGGRPEVYVQTFPGRGARQQVSVGGGSQPRWAPIGTELFYVAPDLTLMSVSIKADGGELHARSPVPLFQSLAFQRDSEYDVSSDGRFLLKLPGEGPRAASITVIVNWHEELKRRLPTN